jgi:hypothetical protein
MPYAILCIKAYMLLDPPAKISDGINKGMKKQKKTEYEHKSPAAQ